MFGQIFKMIKIGMLQKGKTVKFSRADLVDLTINLLSVKKMMNPDKYKEVYDLYLKISKDNKKIDMNLETYNSVINDMTNAFIAIEPSILSELKK